MRKANKFFLELLLVLVLILTRTPSHPSSDP